jgi:hypothetical protein
MANLQIYRAADNDWATHVEMVINEPIQGREESVELPTQTDNPVRFVLAIVSTPEGSVPPDLDAGVLILDRNGRSISSYNAPGNFINAPSRLVIFNEPDDRIWQISTYGFRSLCRIGDGVSSSRFHLVAKSQRVIADRAA